MRRTITENYVLILGGIWWPYGALCSLRVNLSSHDLASIGEFTRENVERWLLTHSGDFSSVKDFYATAGDIEIPWSSEENELAYLDTISEFEEV